MCDFTFYCTAFVCIFQGRQMVGKDHWALFSGVMNALFMWPLQKKRIRTWIYGGETETWWRTWIYSQMLALQKQRHLTCNLDHFLVPSIAPTKKEIKIYFYDSKRDILLESRWKNLCIEILGIKRQPHSYKAILAVWLVVNYKFLCYGPHESLLQVPKARFCYRAGACIDMYEMELSIKLVRLHSTRADFRFTDILKLEFILPSDLSSRPIVNENN